LSRRDQLARQFERVTALRIEEFMAQRMQLLDGAHNWIRNSFPDDYDISVHEVVLVAEFLAGERSDT
jgi:hypothetical protein